MYGLVKSRMAHPPAKRCHVRTRPYGVVSLLCGPCKDGDHSKDHSEILGCLAPVSSFTDARPCQCMKGVA